MTNADKERIITMTHLAAYDKNKAAGDNRVNSYFLHDYIYKNNMLTRIAVITGCIILIAFNLLHRIFNEFLDITTLDYVAELKKYGLFVLAAALFYTVIGSIKSVRDYHLCQKRIKEYTGRIEKLEKLVKLKPKKTKEHQDVSSRNSIVYTRNPD